MLHTFNIHLTFGLMDMTRYELHEEAGMSNHPFHVPRTVAIYSALEYLEELVDGKVNTDFLLVRT